MVIKMGKISTSTTPCFQKSGSSVSCVSSTVNLGLPNKILQTRIIDTFYCQDRESPVDRFTSFRNRNQVTQTVSIGIRGLGTPPTTRTYKNTGDRGVPRRGTSFRVVSPNRVKGVPTPTGPKERRVTLGGRSRGTRQSHTQRVSVLLGSNGYKRIKCMVRKFDFEVKEGRSGDSWSEV